MLYQAIFLFWGFFLKCDWLYKIAASEVDLLNQDLIISIAAMIEIVSITTTSDTRKSC